MNQFVFAWRNIFDKANKVYRDKKLLAFYLNEYVWNGNSRIEPDSFVVSYPKCGRTWLRVLLLKYIASQSGFQDASYGKSYVRSPGNKIVKFEHDQGSWVPAPPQIKKLHFNTRKYAEKSVLFLIRDPRDVVVSSWYHLKYRENIFSGDLSTFIRDDLVGIDKIIAFMNLWADNLTLLKNVLIVSYEELRKDTPYFFGKVLDFLEISNDTKLVRETVVAVSFERMKKIEQDNSHVDPWLRVGSRNNILEASKIRKGKVGGYKNELSVNDIEFLDNVIRKKMSSKLISHFL